MNNNKTVMIIRLRFVYTMAIALNVRQRQHYHHPSSYPPPQWNANKTHSPTTTHTHTNYYSLSKEKRCLLSLHTSFLTTLVHLTYEREPIREERPSIAPVYGMANAAQS